MFVKLPSAVEFISLFNDVEDSYPGLDTTLHDLKQQLIQFVFGVLFAPPSLEVLLGPFL